MDSDTPSIAEFARALGVDPATIHRRVTAVSAGRPTDLLDSATQKSLISQYGIVPSVEGFTRIELLVLAALSRSPLGVRSVRAIARRASVSPTTAGKVLDRLVAVGLVTIETRRFVEGTVVEGHLWAVDVASTGWQRIAATVGKVVLPQAPPLDRARRVPQRFGHHFWTGSLEGLDLDRDGAYIASRMVLSDDPQAIAWSAAHLSSSALRRCAASRGISEPHRSLLHGMARDARSDDRVRAAA